MLQGEVLNAGHQYSFELAPIHSAEDWDQLQKKLLKMLSCLHLKLNCWMKKHFFRISQNKSMEAITKIYWGSLNTPTTTWGKYP